MLADDLIEGEESLGEEGEVLASSLGRSRAGNGLIAGGFVVAADDNVAGSSGVTLDSEAMISKLGGVVEIGIDDWLKLGGNLSMLFVEKGELELAADVLGSGGRAFVAVVFAGLAVGGIKRGAGCIVELEGLGNEIDGTVDSGAFELAIEELVKGEFVLDENPFDGALLNISKPFDVPVALPGLAELLEEIGDGPETSGMV